MKEVRRERILTRSLLVVIVVTFAILLANTLVTRDGARHQQRATEWVTHTYQVLRELDGVASALYEAEAAQRALVLMNDESYAAPYQAATRRLGQRLDRVRALLRDNPPQLARVSRLAGLVEERLTQMDRVVATSRELGLMAARQELARNGNKATGTAIRELVAGMEDDETNLLESRLAAWRASVRRAERLNLLAGGLALLALAAFVLLVTRTLRQNLRNAAEISRQREILRVTLLSIGDAVVTTDAAAQVVALNREAERLTGWSMTDAAGKPLERIFRIVNETTRQPVDNPATRALRQGKVVGLANHTILLAKDGREVPIDDSAAPIRDADGRVSGVVLVFRDVTEERAVSNRLHQLAAELSEADRRKNEFLATLAHEIRNPLAAIRTSVALLHRVGQDPQAASAALGAIERQMRHLVRLVEDLLDVARISRGKLALQQSRIDLRQALQHAVETSRPLCEETEQALEVEIPGHALYVHGDGVRITQAISNLLNNACKFSPRGGHIRFSVRIENQHAVVSIRDTGIGIAAEQLPRIFDMFNQVDSRLERTQGGLGIGLNLVKRLVEMHGGRVEARSEGVGRGSEFVVHFPLLVETAADAKASQADDSENALASAAPGESPAETKIPADPRPLQILVVDDNLDSAGSLALLLQLEGHRTTVAHDGLEAVEVALRDRPEVVLLDIGLPGLNGYEVARRIRSGLAGRELFLIAVTGWGQEADQQRSRESGFDRHLVKPVDADELLKLLSHFRPLSS